MISAHLIFGKDEEPFLPALFDSLEGVVDRIIVNDNSENFDCLNARALRASSFARNGNAIVDHTPFVDFSQARNHILNMHRQLGCGEWAAFVDADEVHRPIARTIARNLKTLAADIAVVDGYTRHYFQSFRLYTSIERRMTFFRVTPNLSWTGRVHERLVGITGQRLAIPYVYDHYGALSSTSRQAAKGRHYSSLGQAGRTVTESELAHIGDREYFAHLWPLALRYHGAHPNPVLAIRRRLEHDHLSTFYHGERIASESQTARDSSHQYRTSP